MTHLLSEATGTPLPPPPPPVFVVLLCSHLRYKVTVEIPVQRALFRVLPSPLQEGKDISTVPVLFTQGINEQQSLADT